MSLSRSRYKIDYTYITAKSIKNWNRKTMPLTVKSQNMKFLSINVICSDLYPKNYKIKTKWRRLKQIERYFMLVDQGSILFGCLSIFPKLIYRFNAIPVTILRGFYIITEKIILKFTWTCKGTRATKTIF